MRLTIQAKGVLWGSVLGCKTIAVLVNAGRHSLITRVAAPRAFMLPAGRRFLAARWFSFVVAVSVEDSGLAL